MKPLALLAALPLCAAAADAYIIDPSHTFPHFRVSHLGFSMHQGRFNETRGSFVLDKDGPDSSVEVTINTASIDTGGDRLERRLREADFFNVAQYPEMRYESTQVRWTGETTATVQGKLTLLGVTRPVTLNITRAHCDTHPMTKVHWCGFEATAKLRRSDFGMKAYVPAVGDDVEITIQAEGGRRDHPPGPRN